MDDIRQLHTAFACTTHLYPATMLGLWWRLTDFVRGAHYVKCNCGCTVYCSAGGPLSQWQCGWCGRMLDAGSQAASPNTTGKRRIS